MNPAVRIQHVLGNVFGVNAIDWIADVLARRYDQREGHEHQNREGVVRSKDQRIDVHMTDANQVLQAAEYVQHGGNGEAVCALRMVRLFVWSARASVVRT